MSYVFCVLPTALRDNRIDLIRASWQELTISIREVSLGDEGLYTCSLFTMPVKTAKAYLTVLGKNYRRFRPVLTKVKPSLGINHNTESLYYFYVQPRFFISHTLGHSSIALLVQNFWSLQMSLRIFGQLVRKPIAPH